MSNIAGLVDLLVSTAVPYAVVESYITEGQFLTHGTSIDNFNKIMSTGKLEVDNRVRRAGTISLSKMPYWHWRDVNLHFRREDLQPRLISNSKSVSKVNPIAFHAEALHAGPIPAHKISHVTFSVTDDPNDYVNPTDPDFVKYTLGNIRTAHNICKKHKIPFFVRTYQPELAKVLQRRFKPLRGRVFAAAPHTGGTVGEIGRDPAPRVYPEF
jgi:hypothetical protein